jgi:SAM-dependent methyltransferase
MLPSMPATVLDVGAGSGRDAAWLAGKGYDVVAVEPSASMRAVATRTHPEAGLRWIEDSLPALGVITRSGLSFDLILLSAVWMHIRAGDRPRAFRKLINLLKPGGFIALTWRNGPSDPGRNFHPVSLAEVKALARNHGAVVEFSGEAQDRLERGDICWMQSAAVLAYRRRGTLSGAEIACYWLGCTLALIPALLLLFVVNEWNWVGGTGTPKDGGAATGSLLALVIALGSGLAMVLWRRATRTDSSHPTNDLSVPR